MRSAISAVQTLKQQQKEAPTNKSIQNTNTNNTLLDREQEMTQALISTIRVLQSERQRQAAETARLAQAGGVGKKSDRESASPVEIKSPKARRRKSKAG